MNDSTRLPSVSLVIAEHGAPWMAWAQRLRRGADGLIVLVQDVDERPAAFAGRVLQRLDRLGRDGTVIREAAVIGGACGSSSCDAARTRITRQLSRRLAREDLTTWLHLDADTRHRGVRTFMRALGRALKELAEGTGVSVLVDSLEAPAPTTA